MDIKIPIIAIIIFSLSSILIFDQASNQAWAGAPPPNVVPVVDAGADDTINEGGTFSSSGSFTDSDTDPWTATVDYGDGTAVEVLTLVGKTFSLSHTYEQDSDLINAGSPFVVTVTINDGTVDSVDTALVTVNNVLPAIVPVADDTINQGDTFAAMGSFTDPGSDGWIATADFDEPGVQIDLPAGICPDGYIPNAAAPDPTAAGCSLEIGAGNTFDLEHTFQNSGVFTVTVTVNDGPSSSSMEEFTVTVNNVSPTLDDPGTGDTIDEGETFTTTGSFSDSGLDPWVLTVDYGDGTGTNNVGFESDKTFELSHLYTDDGTFTVTVTIDDGTATPVSGSFSVTVNNVAPIVDAGPDATIGEGDTFLSVGSFTDPGTEPFSATVDYGDGGGPVVLALTPDKTFLLNHVYPDEGTFTVTVTVDDGTATDSDDAIVTVENVAPTISFGMGSVDDTKTFSSTGSFTDPGLDSWMATVDYGDGSGVQPLTLSGKTFSLNHQYAANGLYTVDVVVTDDDGDSGSASTGAGVFVSTELPTPGVISPTLALTSFNQDATFQTFNQNLWGGSGMIQNNLFPRQTWNERGGDSDIRTVEGFSFGAGIDAGTSGNVEMFSKYQDLEGTTDVTYPGNIKVEHAALNSFLAGENIPIGGTWTFDTAAADLPNAHTMGDFALFFRLAVNAFVNTNVCLFSCTSLFSIPSVGFDTGITQLFSIDKADSVETSINNVAGTNVLTLAAFDVFAPSPLPMFGPIAADPVKTGAHSNGKITAMDDFNKFASMQLSLTDLGPAGVLGKTTPPVVDGVSLGYTIFDSTDKIQFFLNQEITFDTDVLVKLDFERPVAGVSGSFLDLIPLGAGVGSVTFMPGEVIQVSLFAGETEPLRVFATALVSPTNSKMTNLSEVLIDNALTMEALKANIMVPGVEVIPEITIRNPIPHLKDCECHGFLCTSGHCHHVHHHVIGTTPSIGSPEISFSIGPLWKSQLNEATVQSTDVIFDREFSVSGFNQVILNSFVLDPEVPPTADADGPYEVLEGSTVLLDGSASFDDGSPNPLVHNWDLDNDLTFETPGEMVNFFGVDGPAIHQVNLEVDDGLNKDTDSSSVTVFNVDPIVSAGADDSVNEGSLFTRSATFTDPGADTWTGIVDWGDGTPDEAIITILPPVGPALPGTFSIKHIYADNDDYTVTVTITDDDAGVGTDSFKVTVNNVVPPVEAGTDQEYVIHDVTSLDPATYSDAGFDFALHPSLEDFTATVNWGEGSDEGLSVSETPGSPGVLTLGTASGTHIYRLPEVYTVTVTVTDDDGGSTSDMLENTILGARDLKERAISFLSPFENESHRVVKAIEHIDKSLEDDFWIDEVFLDAKHGHRVYSEEHNAVQQLQQLLNPSPDENGEIPPPPSPELKQAAEDAIDLLVNSDRVLTITRMLESSAAIGDKQKDQDKIDRENATAEDEFAKGDASRDSGDFDNAIQHYRMAWHHAGLALKAAS